MTMESNTFYKRVSCVLAGAAISACGSGGDSSVDLAAKYAGTWASTCYANGDSVYYYQEAVSLTRTSDASLSYQGSVATYTDSGCTGAAQDVSEYSGIVALSGGKTIAGVNVDQADISIRPAKSS